MDERTKTIEIQAQDSIQIQDQVGCKLESCYLLVSHRDKARALLEKSVLEQTDVMDLFISLHIVLETGVNAFFRQILPTTKHSGIFPIKETTEHLDRINFREKIIMFLYSGSFDFVGKEKDACEYQRIIGHIRNFSGMRNSLLHGHAVCEWHQGADSGRSSLSKNLNSEKVKSQLKYFRDILEGLAFYFGCYTQGGFTAEGKANLTKMYLDTSFLFSHVSD